MQTDSHNEFTCTKAILCEKVGLSWVQFFFHVPKIWQLTLGGRTEDETVACEGVSQLCHCAGRCRVHNKHLWLFKGAGCNTDRS